MRRLEGVRPVFIGRSLISVCGCLSCLPPFVKDRRHRKTRDTRQPQTLRKRSRVNARRGLQTKGQPTRLFLRLFLEVSYVVSPKCPKENVQRKHTSEKTTLDLPH